MDSTSAKSTDCTSCLNFEDLPTEIQVKVFSYLTKKDLLSSAAPVCRAWRDLAWHSPFWRELCLNTDCDKESVCIFDRVPQLTSLTVKRDSIHDRAVSTQTILIHVRKCKTLREMNLIGVEIVSDCVKEMAKDCPRVRYVNFLSCVSPDYEPMTFVAQWKELEELHLQGYLNVDDNGLKKLIEHCPKLKAISLYCDTTVTDHVLSELIESRSETIEYLHIVFCISFKSVLKAISRCDRLVSLILTRTGGNDGFLSDFNILKIGNLQNLKHLTLQCGAPINLLIRGFLRRLFVEGAFQDLVYLNLRVTGITKEIVRAIARKCQHLNYLTFDVVGNNCVKEIVKYCPDLLYLDFCSEDIHSDLSSFLVSPFPLHELEYLRLCGNRRTTRYNAISQLPGLSDLSLQISRSNPALKIAFMVGRYGYCVYANGKRLSLSEFHKKARIVRKCDRTVVIV